MSEEKILYASENSIQIQFEQKICPEVNKKILAFLGALEALSQKEGLTKDLEVVPTYAAVSIYFDEKVCQGQKILNLAERALEESKKADKSDLQSGKIVEIPVCYQGEDFAPDLEDLARHSGLSKEEVITLHSSTPYLIYMLGFLPGFPYLGGMDPRLECPRLKTPRTKIPAGSIAIGGSQTGLYPSDSPGGWRIIGRTPLKVFDQNRNPACLYQAGDYIKFKPISPQEFAQLEKSNLEKKASSGQEKIQSCPVSSGIQILDGGLSTTVQDLGRFGFQSWGIGQSGVMDEKSYRKLNQILGNDENAACLEATLSGPEIKFTLEGDFAVTGAQVDVTLDGKAVPMNQKIHAPAGSIVKTSFAKKGLRFYLGFAGGLIVPQFLGSSSTNLKGKMGGYFGRKIQAGDQIPIGFTPSQDQPKLEPQSQLQNQEEDFLPQSQDLLILSCMKGSQYDFFSSQIIKDFQNRIWQIHPQSDRMGIRFSGQELDIPSSDIISDAIPFGAVQITSSGLPLVMASDRQTTGGYAKIATVTKESMCRLAQALPGSKVSFRFI